MEKKFEDEELNKLLNEQLVKEAELIEQALFSDDSFEDYEETDEELKASYQKLVERLKADGVYREDDENDSDGSDTGSGDEVNKEQDENGIHSVEHKMSEGSAEKVVAMPVSDKTEEKRKASKSHKIAKAAGFVVVGTLCVFAASMTSEANRTYFIDKLYYMMGDDTRIIIDNDNNNETVNSDEYEAKGVIQEKLGVEMPEFMYRPIHFEYYDFDVSSYAQVAFIEYKYEDVIISLCVDKKNKIHGSVNFSLHGNEIGSIDMKDEDISINIIEVRDEMDNHSSYVAQWKRKGIFYQISGKMDKEEFYDLVEGMKF